jgi:hypothetical protein
MKAHWVMPDWPGGESDEPLVLGALEPDQLVVAKQPFGRRRLTGSARFLMWALRVYVVLSLVVVAVRILQATHG